jgi:hypothetical protein
MTLGKADDPSTVRPCCKACHHQAPADLQAIIDVGKGDRPLKDLKFSCTECGSSLTDCQACA